MNAGSAYQAKLGVSAAQGDVDAQLWMLAQGSGRMVGSSPWSDGLKLTDDRCEPGPRTPVASGSEVVPSCGGSGDKQASAKFCRLEIDEVAVAFGPPT